MKKLFKNELGFRAVEILLVVLIIAVVGFGGYYVYSRNKTSSNSTSTPTATSTTKASTPPVKSVDPTVDWVAYSSQEGRYSLKYPKTWAKASRPDLCTPGLLLLGGNIESVGRCASESFGQMNVFSISGNDVSNLEIKSSVSSDLVTETVTINGVKGEKQTGSFVKNIEGSEEKAKKVIYLFYTNNRTYSATYIIDDSYPDVLNDFNTMVTKTLKFQP